MAKDFIVGRGKDFCRGCSESSLFSALDLGDLPIANELWSNENEVPEIFPLHLRICASCGLGQVEDVVTPTRLFRDYRYLSSISSSFVEHARMFALEVREHLNIEPNEWILEIASNDGYLLKHFIDLGIPVLGIEPAENVARIASASGVPTISEFFGTEIAKELVEQRGYPRLIVANNVMAHVPDLQDFVEGLAIMTGQDTVISIENPSLMNFLDEDQFDTIYHEHYSYLTANSVEKIVRPFNLELFDLEQTSTHGGSIRYWLRALTNLRPSNPKVHLQIEDERAAGLFSQEEWDAFSARVQSTLTEFHNWLKNSYDRHMRVYGYGAAAKASTLLNAAKIERAWLVSIADGSHEKQGRFMPIEAIPIVSPEVMFESEPTDIVIFPWNIKDELVKVIREGSKSETRIWRAIPHLEQIG